jgi:N-acyl-D-aspartate/D-glutamate deacylase
MESDVKAARVAATGTLVAHSTRVKGLYVVATAVAGSVVLRDGGAGGSVIATIDTPAVVGAFPVDIPGTGLRFGTDVHAPLSNVTAVTAFHA